MADFPELEAPATYPDITEDFMAEMEASPPVFEPAAEPVFDENQFMADMGTPAPTGAFDATYEFADTELERADPAEYGLAGAPVPEYPTEELLAEGVGVVSEGTEEMFAPEGYELEAPEEAFEPGPEPEPMTVAEQAQSIANRGREALAFQEAEAHAAREKERAEGERLANAKNALLAEEALEKRQKADTYARQQLDEIAQESAQLAQEKIDTGNWYKTRSTGQKIGAWITAILGGLLSPHRGGRNTGLEMIQGEIDKDIAAQKTDLMNRRNALIDQRGSVRDMLAQNEAEWRAEEVARQAAYQNAIAQVKSAYQGFDPEGTAARNGARLLLGLEEAKAAGDAKAADAARKWWLETDKRKHAWAELEEKRRSAMAKEQLTRMKARGSGKTKVDNFRNVFSGRSGKLLGVVDVKHGQTVKEFQDRDTEITDEAVALRDLIKEAQKHGRMAPGKLSGFLESPEAASYRAKYNNYMLAKINRLTGAGSSEKERENIYKTMPMDSFLQRGKAETIMRDTLHDLGERRRMLFHKYNVRHPETGELSGDEAAAELLRGVDVAKGRSRQSVADLESVITTDEENPSARLSALTELHKQLSGRDPDIALRPNIKKKVEAGIAFVEKNGLPDEQKKAKALRQQFKSAFGAAKGKNAPKEPKGNPLNSPTNRPDFQKKRASE